MDFTTTIASIFNIIAQTTNDTGALNWLAEKYTAGGGFMHPILASLVIGLAFSFERLWTLTKARTNTKKFIVDVKKALNSGGVDAAKKVCENTSGPVASVFYAGLLRYDEGLDAAEKAIVAYGGIEMGFLERGLIWISTFITIAPMLGFTG
ncbi:MAG TPA: MotA/TolQ/ExbB proton channel family protein, partial [Ignavibacteriaceae bacterium]|nr:MotA/TolQ/ExbB proton channel family protein [Ignavibacteriaceae bacterium]